jgi:hypothetical protein
MPRPFLPIGSNAIAVSAQFSSQSTLSGKCLPTLKGKPKVGGFAVWVAEPGVPRLVRSLSGDKVTLFEPGADDGSGRKIVAAFLDAIDLDVIIGA